MSKADSGLELIKQIASDYHLPGPTNLREAVSRGYRAGEKAAVERLLAVIKDAENRFFYIRNLSTNLWRDDPKNLEAICRSIRKYADEGHAKLAAILAEESKL